MDTIKTFAELLKVPFGTRIYHVVDGNIESMYMGGGWGANTSVMLVYSESSVVFLREKNFDKGVYLLRENYEPVAVGLLMIQQITEWSQNEIAKIKDVYLKGEGHNA